LNLTVPPGRNGVVWSMVTFNPIHVAVNWLLSLDYVSIKRSHHSPQISGMAIMSSRTSQGMLDSWKLIFQMATTTNFIITEIHPPQFQPLKPLQMTVFDSWKRLEWKRRKDNKLGSSVLFRLEPCDYQEKERLFLNGLNEFLKGIGFVLNIMGSIPLSSIQEGLL